MIVHESQQRQSFLTRKTVMSISITVICFSYFRHCLLFSVSQLYVFLILDIVYCSQSLFFFIVFFFFSSSFLFLFFFHPGVTLCSWWDIKIHDLALLLLHGRVEPTVDLGLLHSVSLSVCRLDRNKYKCTGRPNCKNQIKVSGGWDLLSGPHPAFYSSFEQRQQGCQWRMLVSLTLPHPKPAPPFSGFC